MKHDIISDRKSGLLGSLCFDEYSSMFDSFGFYRPREGERERERAEAEVGPNRSKGRDTPARIDRSRDILMHGDLGQESK